MMRPVEAGVVAQAPANRTTPRCVIVCSPFGAVLDRETRANVRYAKRCLQDSLRRGEAPFLAHLLYPHVLDDRNPAERAQGMAAGDAWLGACRHVVVYADRGISRGMLQTIARWAEDAPGRVDGSLVVRYLTPERE